METFDPLDGAVLVDKPVGPTSHDIVDRIRRHFGIKKVGHAGTLDPNASGLLIKTFNQRYTKGDHKMNLDLSMLPAGSYNLQLKDDIGNVQTLHFIKAN